jgi:hypothetical protein
MFMEVSNPVIKFSSCFAAHVFNRCPTNMYGPCFDSDDSVDDMSKSKRVFTNIVFLVFATLIPGICSPNLVTVYPCLSSCSESVAKSVNEPTLWFHWSVLRSNRADSLHKFCQRTVWTVVVHHGHGHNLPFCSWSICCHWSYPFSVVPMSNVMAHTHVFTFHQLVHRSKS